MRPLRRLSLLIGLLLLGGSLYMLLLQVREAVVSAHAYACYQVQRLESTPSDLQGHEVVVRAEHLFVDGNPRLTLLPGSRRALLFLTDRRRGTTRMALVEMTGGEQQTSWVFRIALVSQNGALREESFKYSERAQPEYRMVLVRLVVPEDIGFTNSSLVLMPSLVYPILFPWSTLGAGVVVSLLALFWRRENVSTAMSTGGA